MIINKRLKNIFQINVSSTRKLFIVVIVIHVIQITYNYKREVDGEEGSNDDTHSSIYCHNPSLFLMGYVNADTHTYIHLHYLSSSCLLT